MHLLFLHSWWRFLGKAYLPKECSVPFHWVQMALLDLWIESFNDIIQHLGSYLIISITGSLPTCDFVLLFENLKRTKPTQGKQDTNFSDFNKNWTPSSTQNKKKSLYIYRCKYFQHKTWYQCWPDKGGSNAQHHWASLHAWIAVVKHISHDPWVWGDYRASTCGRNPKSRNGFAAQKLADAGAQNFTSICLPEERLVWYETCYAE